MIKSYPPLVYDSVVAVSHTGDVIWQTGLNVTGKGKAEIHLGGSNNTFEIKITVDGTLLTSTLTSGNTRKNFRFIVEHNISLLVEYRVSNGADTAYLDIMYYNR